MVKDRDRLLPEDLNGTIGELVDKLTEGSPTARMILMLAVVRIPLFVLTVDTRRLYGDDIYDVFRRVCGDDMDRFLYHVAMELPNQATGEMSVTGPWSSKADDAWFAARSHGAENIAAGGLRRFWALADPPLDDPNYDYPFDASSGT